MSSEVYKIKDWLFWYNDGSLNKDNLVVWKKYFDKLFKKHHNIDDYSKTLYDSEWLEMYEGVTPIDAYNEEISNWDY